MNTEFRPITLNNESDNEGMLVLLDGRLTAVLSRLSQQHGNDAGHWFIECGFGPLNRREEQFSDLNAVKTWIKEQLR